jgi:outer membrane lipopolysaccharide assembly protein LptE/RlpB
MEAEMKKMLSVLMMLSALNGCGTWHYEGTSQAPAEPDDSSILSEDPQPASCLKWNRYKAEDPVEIDDSTPTQL